MARRTNERVESLLSCPTCKLELRLFGIETENPTRELYTFECEKCGALEVRGVKVK
jgi:C4-type Zn-finger protein